MRSFYPALVLEGHENAVHALCDAGDGYVVSASLDTTLRVWDLHTGKCVRHLRSAEGGHVGGILCLTRMQVDGMCMPPAIFRGAEACLRCVGLLLSGGRDKTMRVWDLETAPHKECVRVLEGHQELLLLRTQSPRLNFLTMVRVP